MRVKLLQRGEAGVTQGADVGPDTVHHLGVGVQMLKQGNVNTGSTRRGTLGSLCLMKCELESVLKESCESSLKVESSRQLVTSTH